MTAVQALKSAVKALLPRSVAAAITVRRYVREVRGHRVPEFRIIAQLMAPGDSAVDLGANFGWFTLFLSRTAGPTGTVFSLEPVPLNFDVLTGIVRALELRNVRCLPYAVSDTDGMRTIAVPAAGVGENLYEARVVEDGTAADGHRHAIPSRTMDSLFADASERITFVKCDIEGHELACLHGAGRFIERHRPAWLMEVWGDPDDASSAGGKTFAAMRTRGYVPYVLDGERLRLRRRGERQNDYFFLTDDHVRGIEALGAVPIERSAP